MAIQLAMAVMLGLEGYTRQAEGITPKKLRTLLMDGGSVEIVADVDGTKVHVWHYGFDPKLGEHVPARSVFPVQDVARLRAYIAANHIHVL